MYRLCCVALSCFICVVGCWLLIFICYVFICSFLSVLLDVDAFILFICCWLLVNRFYFMLLIARFDFCFGCWFIVLMCVVSYARLSFRLLAVGWSFVICCVLFVWCVCFICYAVCCSFLFVYVDCMLICMFCWLLVCCFLFVCCWLVVVISWCVLLFDRVTNLHWFVIFIFFFLLLACRLYHS